MKQTLNEYDFRRAFETMRPDNFSYEGLGLLFESLEQYEDNCGQEMELDVVAICCDFSEEPWKDIADNYSIDISDCDDEDEAIEAVETYLQEHTYFVGRTADNSMIYQAF